MKSLSNKQQEKTKLTSTLRLTTSECMHLVTHGRFRSRDKHGGHNIWSAVAENKCCSLNYTTNFSTGENYTLLYGLYPRCNENVVKCLTSSLSSLQWSKDMAYSQMLMSSTTLHCGKLKGKIMASIMLTVGYCDKPTVNKQAMNGQTDIQRDGQKTIRLMTPITDSCLGWNETKFLG